MRLIFYFASLLLISILLSATLYVRFRSLVPAEDNNTPDVVPSPMETATQGKNSSVSGAESTVRTSCPPLASSPDRNLTEQPVLVVAPSMGGEYSSKPKLLDNCPVPCAFTTDAKTYLSKADVRLWFLLSFDYPRPGNMPKKECPNLHFALVSMESHANYPFLATVKQFGYDILMDYRLSSDVPVPYYGIPDVMRPVTDPTTNTDVLASAFISNCGARSDRTRVLKELLNYIKIDSYGRCDHNMDIPSDVKHLSPWNQKTALIKRYKFNLSFENSDSEDYVTEKFYQPLEAGTVPVFLGTRTIYKFAPSPKSYIDVRSFPSVKDLADYLIYLSQNDTAYNEFLAYKTPGYPQSQSFKELHAMSQISSHCRLCMRAANMDVKDYWEVKDVLPRIQSS